MRRRFKIFVPVPFPPAESEEFAAMSAALKAYTDTPGTKLGTLYVHGYGTTWHGSYPEEAALSGSRFEEALIDYAQAASDGSNTLRAHGLTIASS